MISIYLQVEWKIVDHNQLAFEKPADLGLHCFKNRNVTGYISLLSYKDLHHLNKTVLLSTQNTCLN